MNNRARWTALLSASTAAALLSGCGADRPPQPTANFDANGVGITVVLKEQSGSDEMMDVTFTPQRSLFHLYSIDLPEGGVDGLGVPTTVTVRGALQATGAPSANVPVRELRFDALDVSLPVYPDGPVTVSVPVRRTGSSRDAAVVVSYGACSRTQCLPPVTDHTIPLRLG
ncbi:hypothetical protein [Peterkaempfera sp. SMS 1(5)a]|uniref:hypothetical protein n=1 Tax=Peterkaempfera podocarpi TaxID=3232308 RepID=UPI00366E5D82